jgi:hypothetical protein
MLELKRENAVAFSLVFGAGEESRTLDLYLGKVSLYQLSYSRRTGAHCTYATYHVKRHARSFSKLRLQGRSPVRLDGLQELAEDFWRAADDIAGVEVVAFACQVADQSSRFLDE